MPRRAAASPVPLIEVSVDGESENKPLLNRAYQVIDKQSYLDWGLTSDYDAKEAALEAAGAEAAAAAAAAATAATGGPRRCTASAATRRAPKATAR